MTQILRRKTGLYWLVVFALVFMIMGVKGMSTEDNRLLAQIYPLNPRQPLSPNPQHPCRPALPQRHLSPL